MDDSGRIMTNGILSHTARQECLFHMWKTRLLRPFYISQSRNLLLSPLINERHDPLQAFSIYCTTE